jgi:DNA-binding response OmpR family regulator
VQNSPLIAENAVRKAMPLVFVLDDRPMVMDLECALAEAGFTVALAITCGEAGRFLKSNTPAAAIFDANLNDSECIEAAKTLVARGVPFMVFSESAGAGLPETFSSAMILNRPSGLSEIVQQLRTMIKGAVGNDEAHLR